MTTQDSERPTDPDNVRPDPEHRASATVLSVPRLRPVPADLVEAIRALPTPNPDSYVEMSVAVLLHGIESQRGIEDLLVNAVRQINNDAAVRELQRAKVVDGNLAAISNEVKSLRVSFEQLAPRVTGTESGIESIRTDMRLLRSEIDSKNHELEQRLALMDRAIQDAHAAAIKHLTLPEQRQ